MWPLVMSESSARWWSRQSRNRCRHGRNSSSIFTWLSEDDATCTNRLARFPTNSSSSLKNDAGGDDDDVVDDDDTMDAQVMMVEAERLAGDGSMGSRCRAAKGPHTLSICVLCALVCVCVCVCGCVSVVGERASEVKIR